MDSIGAYLLAAISVGIATGIAAQASHPALRGTVESVGGILLLLAVVSPLLSLIALPPSADISLPEMELPEGSEYVEVATAAMEEGIAEELAESFSLPRESIRVICEGLDASVMRLGSVRVLIAGSPADADYRAIREHVRECYIIPGTGECEVQWIYE